MVVLRNYSLVCLVHSKVLDLPIAAAFTLKLFLSVKVSVQGMSRPLLGVIMVPFQVPEDEY